MIQKSKLYTHRILIFFLFLYVSTHLSLIANLIHFWLMFPVFLLEGNLIFLSHAQVIHYIYSFSPCFFFQLAIYSKNYLSAHRSLLYYYYFLMFTYCAPMWLCHHLLNHSPKYWHLGYFQLFAIRNCSFKE